MTRGWTCGTWTCAGSAPSTARPATRSRGSSRTTRPTTTSVYPGTAIRGPAAADLAGLPVARRARAVFGEKAGWERVNCYACGARRGRRAAAPRLGRAGWSPWVEPEHRPPARRLRCSTSRPSPRSRSAGRTRRVRRARLRGHVDAPVGAVTYTPALDHRGGVAMDVTVTRVAPEAFMVVTGTASGRHDLAWLRRPGRPRVRRPCGSRTSPGPGRFALWGPRARDVLAPLTPADLSNAAFPYLTMQETTVGDVPVRALRVTYVGELGWELYCPAEYGAGLWRALVDAGEPHGLRPAGYRAIESLRLEKGYRVWGADVTRDTTRTRRAWRSRCVLVSATREPRRWRQPGRRARPGAGTARRLRCLMLDDPRVVALGGEPVRGDDAVAPLGHVTSGGYGYTVGARSPTPCCPRGSGWGRGAGAGRRGPGRRRGGPRPAVRPEGRPHPRLTPPARVPPDLPLRASRYSCPRMSRSGPRGRPNVHSRQSVPTRAAPPVAARGTPGRGAAGAGVARKPEAPPAGGRGRGRQGAAADRVQGVGGAVRAA